MLSKALNGITVLDFSQGIAGPYSTCLLRDMGAEVIKIEPPAGDWIRGMGHRHGNTSAMFGYYNRGKSGIVLDLKKPEDKHKALEMIRQADVMVESSRAGVAKRLGLGYEAVSRTNPGLIYLSVTGFGQQGPSSDFPATDAIVQAYTGFSFGAGDMKTPVRVRMPIIDITTGLYASHAMLAALLARVGNGGKGQYIDISLMHGISAIQGMKYAEYQANKGVISGELYAAIGIYQTRDGHIVISAVRDQQVIDFIREIGLSQVLDDTRYATQQARYDNQDSLRVLIQAQLLEQPSAHWLQTLQGIGLMCQPVQTYPEFRRDPQALVYELFQEMDLGCAQPLPVVRMPGLSAAEANLQKAPGLGADRQAVLKRFGLSD